MQISQCYPNNKQITIRLSNGGKVYLPFLDLEESTAVLAKLKVLMHNKVEFITFNMGEMGIEFHSTEDTVKITYTTEINIHNHPR
jgi:hypothetical protein